jgi:hypothetical protein
MIPLDFSESQIMWEAQSHLIRNLTGKIANCQVAVSLHWSSAEASCPLVW